MSSNIVAAAWVTTCALVSADVANGAIDRIFAVANATVVAAEAAVDDVAAAS